MSVFQKRATYSLIILTQIFVLSLLLFAPELLADRDIPMAMQLAFTALKWLYAVPVILYFRANWHHLGAEELLVLTAWFILTTLIAQHSDAISSLLDDLLSLEAEALSLLLLLAERRRKTEE